MRRKAKKMAAVLCAVGMAVSMLAGCSGTGGSEGTKETTGQTTGQVSDETEQTGDGERWMAQESMKIRFATNSADTDDRKNAWADLVAAYQEVQPNVEVEIVPMDWENQRNWLTMQLTGGTAPEVFHSKLPWAMDDYNKGMILNLNDVMKAKNPYTDTETWEEFFAPTVIEQMQAVSPDYFCTCNFMSIVKLFYNKSMFEQAGITQLPETWNEFMDVQKKLKEAGFAPFAFPNSKPADNLYNWVERLLTYQVVEDIIPELDVNGSGSVENNEIVRGIDLDLINIENSPYKDVFPILKDWSQYWAEGYNAIDSTTSQQMFIRQEAAMMLGGPDVVQNMADMGADFEYGVFAFPYLTKENSEYACEASYEMGASVAEVYCIPSNLEGEQQKAAIDFLQFLGSPKAMEICAEQMYFMPTAAEPVTDSLKGWEPEGRTVKLNLYGPAVDQTFFEDSVLFGQLYISEDISLEEYLGEMQTSLKDMAERLKETNGWNEENNYGIVE